MTNPQESLPLLPPEVHRAIVCMRNWVYINLALTLACIPAALAVKKFDYDLHLMFIPLGLYFIYGMALCHTVEMRMKRGSLLGSRMALLTTNGTIAISVPSIVALCIGIVAAIFKHHPKEIAIEGSILIFMAIFFYPSIRTRRILLNAIDAMPKASHSFGFPVEFNASAAPQFPTAPAIAPENLSAGSVKY